MMDLIETVHISSIRGCLNRIRKDCGSDLDVIALVVKAVGRKRLIAWLKAHPPS